MRSLTLCLILFGLALVPFSPTAADEPKAPATQPASEAVVPTAWTSLITAKQLQADAKNPNLLIIDVRSAEDYAAGHIPGAINIPGQDWRTPGAKPGQGDSQYIFRKADGSPDIVRYEKLLSEAGVRNDHHVVIYGDHAGKATGSVPAFILDWLGHAKVTFLDGKGLEQWKKADGTVSTEARVLEASTYKATPREGVIWNLDHVLDRLADRSVVFYDTRSAGEFAGTDKRDNARGGHIPGAVLCDYAEFLAKDDKTTLSPSDIKQKLDERGITPDKTVVLYCQTATRTSLPYLVLRDLGFEKIAIYDASWHEYGNRDDTPIVEPEAQSN